MQLQAEALAELGTRFSLSAEGLAAIERLVDALEREPDPPTTVRDPVGVLDVHIADSLSALDCEEVRNAERIADIGAGAGFPGLPLAIALPRAGVDLIESTARKCEVIERLAATAGLHSRVRAIPRRAEEWAAGEGRGAYDVVTARALAPLAVLVEYAAPLLREGGTLVAWKGTPGAQEEAEGVAAAAEVGLDMPKKLPVVPFEGSQRRHLYLYSKVRPTPDRFPRRAGMAAKRPLGSLRLPQPADGQPPREGDRSAGAKRP